MKKSTKLMAFALAAAMMLTACGSSGGGTATTAAPAPAATQAAETTKATEVAMDVATTAAKETQAPAENAAPAKDTFVFTLISEPNNIGHAASNNNGRFCTLQVYDSLLMENGGDRTDLLPNLAESWEWSEDGKTLTFKIKEGVKFHNGETMTAEDVAFSLEDALAEPSNAATAVTMESVEIVDDTHVAVHLPNPYKPVLNILATPDYCIYNKAYIEDCRAKDIVIDKAPMGTGAYKFVDWKLGEEINFERFDDYHGDVAKIKNLKVKIMTDATTAALALENGETDAMIGFNTADMPRLDANPDVEMLRSKSAGYHWVIANSRKAPFDDVRVRQAIMKAINVEEVFVGGHESVGWITNMPITHGIFGYDESFEREPFDLEGAKALLAEAGYPDGFHCVLKVKQDSYYSTPAQVCVENLRKLGLDCEILIEESGTFDSEVSTNYDFDLAYFMSSALYPDADAIVTRTLYSESADKPNSNFSGCKDPELDELILKAKYSLDDEERKELYRQIAQINKEKAHIVPLVTSTNTVGVRSNVVGAYPHSSSAFRIAWWSFQ